MCSTRRAALLGSILALALAACGDDSDDGTAMSAAEYREKANALCVEDQRAAKRLGDIDTPGSIEPYLRRTLKYSRKRTPLYEALEPPEELRKDHEASLKLNRDTEGDVADLLSRIEDGRDPIEEFSKAAPALGRAVERSNTLSRRMGTRKCIIDVPEPGAQPREDVS